MLKLVCLILSPAYFCPTWSWSVQPCKTHRPTITYMRAPGTKLCVPVVFLVMFYGIQTDKLWFHHHHEACR